MLSESIESLVVRRFEDLTERVSACPFNLDRLEILSSALLLLEDHVSILVCKPYLAGGTEYVCLDGTGRYGDYVISV